MKNRVIVIGAILSTLILVGISGCQSETKNSHQAETTGLPMKVASSYWPGVFWVDIAHEKGWFKEAGLDIELIDTRADYYASLTDMLEGRIDVNGFSLFDMMQYNIGGSDLVMVINADNSNGAEAIIGSPEIDSLQALRGKNIGVNKGSYLQYILEAALNRNGLDINEVILTEILAENAVDAFKKESIEAVISYEPFVSEVIEKADGRKLFDTSEIPGISPNGQVFHRSFIDERPGDVQAFVNVWNNTTLFIKQEPKQAFDIISRINNQTPGEVQTFAQLDKILDLRENSVAFSFGSGFESLHGSARKINNFLIQNGVTDKQMDSTEFIDGRFLRTLRENID